MARPIIPGLSTEQQTQLYEQLRRYNEGRDSYKVSGAYLIVLPYAGKSRCSLWFYSPEVEKNPILFVDDLLESVTESLRRASALCFHSVRKLFIVEYNEKRMATHGDDLIGFGKYRGHYLYEVLKIDPAYVNWIASKYTPRIPKQVRFTQMARAYMSAYVDFSRQKPTRGASQYLGKKGERLKDLSLRITHIRLEDDPYRTCTAGGSTVFYVSQVLYAEDRTGNRVILSLPALYPSLMSGKLSAMERAFRVGEIIRIASARISQAFTYKGIKYTRLNYVKLQT